MWDPIQQWKCREMPGKGSSACNENWEETGMQTDTQLESQAEKWLTSWRNSSFGEWQIQSLGVERRERSSKTSQWALMETETAQNQLEYQSYDWNILMSVCCTPTVQREQDLNLLSPSWGSSVSISQINKPPNARTHTSFHPKQNLAVLSPGNQLYS